MPYVRSRMAPASKEYARKRTAINRQALAYSPAAPGVRFTGAYDWFRAALAYAQRRSYRTLAIGDAAMARREQIIAEAALLLKQRGDEIDALVPKSFRRRTIRAELRVAYDAARTLAERSEAARVWFAFIAKQAERCRGDVASRAAVIKDDAAAVLIGWAEEMDADDYGE
jgi:hypothetical protein